MHSPPHLEGREGHSLSPGVSAGIAPSLVSKPPITAVVPIQTYADHSSSGGKTQHCMTASLCRESRTLNVDNMATRWLQAPASALRSDASPLLTTAFLTCP